jgi:hypothetical protein
MLVRSDTSCIFHVDSLPLLFAEEIILDAGEVIRVTSYSGSGALPFDEVAKVLEREQSW